MKIKTNDVKIFSQTYEAAGGKDLFPYLEPVGFTRFSAHVPFIHVWDSEAVIKVNGKVKVEGHYIYEIDTLNFPRHKNSFIKVKDSFSNLSAKIPIELMLTEVEGNYARSSYYYTCSLPPLAPILKESLAKMNINYLFNYKLINSNLIEGDAYRNK